MMYAMRIFRSGGGGAVGMTSCELTAAITALANMIASRVADNNILNLLAQVLNQLGDTLATIAAQRQFLGDSEKANASGCKGKTTARAPSPCSFFAKDTTKL